MEDFLLFVAVGFAAQLIDGALGMAYGASATTVLLSMGTPPAVASAAVHAAEVFTTGASGYSHWRFGNVNKKLVLRLAIPGMAGGALGALALVSFPAETMRPIVSGYLLVLGGIILFKAMRPRRKAPAHPRHVEPLGFAGGFLDAAGGGGWGPVVASTLIGGGNAPRMVIGSVNLAEFFVTAVTTGAFVFTIGLELWPVIAGLVLGGVIAAPLGAFVARRVPDRPLMLLVGALIVILSLRGLVLALW